MPNDGVTVHNRIKFDYEKLCFEVICVIREHERTFGERPQKVRVPIGTIDAVKEYFKDILVIPEQGPYFLYGCEIEESANIPSIEYVEALSDSGAYFRKKAKEAVNNG